MKKISYVFTLIALLLLPTICFAQTIDNSNSISDIKVENSSTDEVKDKVIISFKVLKDLDISNTDMLHLHGDLTTTDENALSDYFSVDFYKSTVYKGDGTATEEIQNTGFKLANDGSCENATEITNNIISKDSTVCVIKEVEKGQTLKGELVIVVEYHENHRLGEEITYSLNDNKISSIDTYDLTYADEMMQLIEKHYNGYVHGAAGDQFSVGFVFDKTVNGTYEADDSVSLGFIYWDYGKDLDYYVQLLDKAIADAGIKFNTQVENNALKKEVLGGIKASKQKAEFETKKDDKVLYAWTFDGAAMEGTDFDIDMNLSIGESTNKDKIENLVKNKKDALVLEFAYHGELPKGTSVKVNVSDTYKDNDILSLYYYNDEGKLELVSKGIKVSDGFAEFALEHCSEYVLVKEDNSNNAQTSSMNVFFYNVLGISSLLGGMYIMKTRKEA